MVRSEAMDKQWQSCIQRNPKCDGEYYVYIFNTQTGDELRTLFYKNNNWQGLTDDETVIAWKERNFKKIVDESKWLKDHIVEIQKLFKLNKVDINDFAIAETLEECICKYESWFHWKQVHLIDDIYVIKILF